MKKILTAAIAFMLCMTMYGIASAQYYNQYRSNNPYDPNDPGTEASRHFPPGGQIGPRYVPFGQQPAFAPPPGMHCPGCNALHKDMPPLLPGYQLHCPKCNRPGHTDAAWHKLPPWPKDAYGQPLKTKPGFDWNLHGGYWYQEPEVTHPYDINEVLKYLDPKAPGQGGAAAGGVPAN